MMPVLIVLFIFAQALLLVYAAHRYLTLWRWARGRDARRAAPPGPPARWPVVTVQLPLYNERLVAERLIDAVAALDYPADRLQIQVLDDSTDQTTACARDAAARHRARGLEIEVLHRSARNGFKAGALANGLDRARGEFIVVFDADFVPDPDFLKRAIPWFTDPRVGMVQARWGHLNRGRSLLTAAQAAMLDAHFLLEHEARMRAGLFFNFNGTAGVWRRSCIVSAGGWTHDTLTEDLDLSYRAQLAGWRFVSVPMLVARAELPADARALKSQQHRWTKGSIQTARKLLPSLLRSRLPLAVKLEACFHLTSNLAYPLLLLSGLLLLPVMTATSILPPRLAVILDLSVIVTGIVPVVTFLALGQLAAGKRGWRVAGDVISVLVLGAGLSLNNSLAVIEGLGRSVGGWERTPKTGDGRPATRPGLYAPRRSWSAWAEILLAVYFAWLAFITLGGAHWRSLPFIALLVVGLGRIGWLSLRSTHARHSENLASIALHPRSAGEL